jgi:hypothetical protein
MEAMEEVEEVEEVLEVLEVLKGGMPWSVASLTAELFTIAELLAAVLLYCSLLHQSPDAASTAAESTAGAVSFEEMVATILYRAKGR